MFIAEHESSDLWMYGDGLLKKKEEFFSRKPRAITVLNPKILVFLFLYENGLK